MESPCLKLPEDLLWNFWWSHWTKLNLIKQATTNDIVDFWRLSSVILKLLIFILKHFPTLKIVKFYLLTTSHSILKLFLLPAHWSRPPIRRCPRTSRSSLGRRQRQPSTRPWSIFCGLSPSDLSSFQVQTAADLNPDEWCTYRQFWRAAFERELRRDHFRRVGMLRSAL